MGARFFALACEPLHAANLLAANPDFALWVTHMFATNESDAERDDVPDEVADAWASVLLDIYEKRRQAVISAPLPNSPEKGDDECRATSRPKPT